MSVCGAPVEVEEDDWVDDGVACGVGEDDDEEAAARGAAEGLGDAEWVEVEEAEAGKKAEEELEEEMEDEDEKKDGK